jgi:hypothetical protein
VIDTLTINRNQINRADAKIKADVLVRGALVEKEGGDLNTSIFREKIRAESLEEFITKCIAEKIHTGKQEEGYENKIESINTPSLYVASLIDQVPLDNEEVKDYLKDIDGYMEQTERFAKIKEKAASILCTDDRIESMIYDDIIQLTKMYLALPAITAEDYDRAQKFIGKSIAKTNMDILYEFLNG